jgi:hypothetical protein
MTLDELMSVWHSQDQAPLHDVNKTLLHLALREDEAKLQKQRRRERWTIYVFGAALVLGLALFMVPMIYLERATVLDFGVAIVGAAAALLTIRALHSHNRARLRREQAFGQSLRDQLARSIDQADDEATHAHRMNVLSTVLMGGVCPAAILVFGWRINQKSISDDGYMLVSLIALCLWTAVASVWQLRRHVEREILPRKQRLEALLKEFDAQ